MKIDMHCHTKASYDTIFDVEQMILAAQARGLDGIAITDHNSTKSWEKGILLAKKHNFLVILGEELMVWENDVVIGEILAYFIKEHIDSRHLNLKQIIDKIHEQNGLAIVAHPWHGLKPFKNLDQAVSLVDGIETFNSRIRHFEKNENALLLAKKLNLAQVGGSDAHTPFDCGLGYTTAQANNLEEFKQAIINKKTTGLGQRTPLWCKAITEFSGLIKHFSK